MSEPPTVLRSMVMGTDCKQLHPHMEYVIIHLRVLMHKITNFLPVSSALESGIRGSVQLLLELGLVDEAKAITEKFMARWISV